MLDYCLSGARAGTEHHVDDTLGYTSLIQYFTQHVCGERREFGGFADNCVAERDGRSDFPRQQIQRQIPRRDKSHDPDRRSFDNVKDIVR